MKNVEKSNRHFCALSSSIEKKLSISVKYLVATEGRKEVKKISHIFKIRILVFCYALNETTYKCRYPLSGAVTPRYYRSSDKGRFLNLSQCVKNRNTWRIRRNGELFGFHALAMFK